MHQNLTKPDIGLSAEPGAMLISDRPGADGNARGLLAKVSPWGGWPACHPVNNCQGWRASGDFVMEIPVTNGNRAGWLLLVVAGVVTNDPRGSSETDDLV